MGAKVSAHVEHVLDEAEPFQQAVKATFSQFAKRAPVQSREQERERGSPVQAMAEDSIPSSATALADVLGRDDEDDSVPMVEEAQLLDAAEALLRMLAEEVDERIARVCLRKPTKRDMEYVLFSDPALGQHGCKRVRLDFEAFERFQRGILKRVAVDRGRRLLLFVAGGIMAVHMVKRTLRRVPLVGPPVVALVNAFLPTPVLGPAVGVAGAAYVDNVPHNKSF